MITEKDYALEEQRIGKRVHLNDGVWWMQTAPWYCKPVHEFRAYNPGSVRPSIIKAPFGYSHQTIVQSSANRSVTWMVLGGNSLSEYSLMHLPGKKRNQVRMGLKNCTVAILMPKIDVLEAMRAINISQAKRFSETDNAPDYLPAEYYSHNAEKWRQDIEMLFGHKGHVFWGVYWEGILVAYADIYQVEDTWIFGAVKSQSEYLPKRPVDALYHSILEMANKDPGCRRVINGGQSGERETLTEFKKQFLFETISYQYYSNSVIDPDRAKIVLNKASYMYKRLFGRKTK